ncbi:hypothetical protein [Chamaesiphon sp.]|uniref:hypothetical protein n=1 Tax=Chamaesiphon sp. TaxID=2814140 RepID=UPI003593AB02
MSIIDKVNGMGNGQSDSPRERLRQRFLTSSDIGKVVAARLLVIYNSTKLQDCFLNCNWNVNLVDRHRPVTALCQRS